MQQNTIAEQNTGELNCTLVATANLLGKPLAEIREVYDRNGAAHCGTRQNGTDWYTERRMLEVITGKPWQRLTNLRAKHMDLTGKHGILTVKPCGRRTNNLWHAVAFVGNVIQDGADIFENNKQVKVKSLVIPEEE